ncbi:MAG: hypothetical protein ACP5PT_01770 [Brevinematia bacterium]
MKKITDTVDFLNLLGLLDISEGVILPNFQVYTSSTGSSYIRSVLARDFIGKVDEVKERFRILLQNTPEIFANIRYGLSYHQANQRALSINTFEKTRVFALIDVDENIPEPKVFEFVEKMEMQPSFIKKTYKGWHFIYATDEFFTKEELQEIFYLSDYVFKLFKYFPSFKKEKKHPAMAETRVVSEQLPVYFNSFYSKSNILQLVDIVKKNAFYIPISNLSRVDIENANNICFVLKELENYWRYHTYSEWELMAYLYALRYITSNEDEKIKEEFIQKSVLWKDYGVKNTLQDIEKQFDYYVKWLYTQIETQSSYLFSCNSIQSRVVNFQTEKFCKHCKANPNCFVFVKTKLNLLQEPFFLKDGVIYKRKVVKEDTEDESYIDIPICYEFSILDVYRINKLASTQFEYFVKLVNNLGESYLLEIDYTSTAKLDLSNFMHAITIYNINVSPKDIEDLLKSMLLSYKQIFRREKELNFVGYKSDFDFVYDAFKNKIIVANAPYEKRDILRLIYGVETDDFSMPLPEVRGDVEVWLQVFREIVSLNDPLMATLIGFSLSHLNMSYFNQHTPFTPLLVVRAEKGAGKTIRLLTTSSLYSFPSVFNYSTITKAKIENAFGRYKFPIYFDEVLIDIKYKDKVEQFREMLYNIANRSFKSDAIKTAIPILSPVVFSGEITNFPIEPLLKGGITRRVLIVDIEKNLYMKRTIEIAKRIKDLKRHYGHILSFIHLFQIPSELEGLFNYYNRKINSDLEVSNLGAIILTNYKIFVEKVLGLTLSNDFENDLIRFFSFRLNTIEEFTNSQEDIYFILKEQHSQVVDIMQREKRYFAGISIKQVLEKAALSFSIAPQDRYTKKLWEMLTGKAYKNKNATYTTYSIKNYSVNLFDSVFFTNDVSFSPSVILEKEKERLLTIKLYIEKVIDDKDLLALFAYVYTQLMKDVYQTYPTYKELLSKHAVFLKENGFITEVDFNEILKIFTVNVLKKQEQVDF